MPADDRAAEARVAAKIQSGDYDAEVEAWIRRFAKKAVITVMRWGYSAADAEDFVQDFWFVLFRNRLKTYDSRQSLFSYCFTMFMNEFRAKGMALIKIASVTDSIDAPRTSDDGDTAGIDLPSNERSPQDMAMAEEDRRALERALNALQPAADRSLLYLRYIEERSAAEIAQVLHIEPGTVRVRIHRALEKLRRNPGGLSNQVAN